MSREMYKKVAPHIDRVRADGGVATDNMNELLLLQRSNEGLKDYLKLAFCPELYGNKIRTSGANNFIAKSYSKEDVGNNLTQTSSANQPYLDKIAPAEKLSAKNPNGGSNYLTHPTISFGASDDWTVETTLLINDSGNTAYQTILGNNDDISDVFINSSKDVCLKINSNYYGLFNIKRYIGKSIIITLCKKNNYIYSYVNGELLSTNSITIASFTISNLGRKSVDYLRCNFFSYHIFSKALSASEVAERSSILRSIFPEIPFTRIGDQIWSVRNFEAVCTPQGNLIPEVQSNTTWATSQTLYDNAYNAAGGAGGGTAAIYAGVKAAAMWSHYNNDPAIGAIYGKLYNWFAVKLLQMDIDYYNANNPTTPWGWRVPTQADFNTLATTLGGASVAGGKMKTVGATYWNSPNTGADNNSGFSAIGVGRRNESGSDGLLNSYIMIGMLSEATSTDYYRSYINNSSNSITIDSVSKKYSCSLRLIKS